MESKSNSAEVFTDKLSGHRFIAKTGNSTYQHFIKNGIFEYPLIKWCQQLLDKNKLFIDIGAHCGTYSILLADYCKEVHSFECQRSTYYQLCGGIVLNEKKNIIAHNFALGSKEEKRKFNKFAPDGGENTLSSTIAQQKANQQKASIETETVQVKSLDSFNFENVGFIKIDVEGWELEVLKGSIKTLEKSGWPKIIFEAWPDAWFKPEKQKIFNFLNKLGYKIIPITGYNNMFLAEKIMAVAP